MLLKVSQIPLAMTVRMHEKVSEWHVNCVCANDWNFGCCPYSEWDYGYDDMLPCPQYCSVPNHEALCDNLCRQVDALEEVVAYLKDELKKLIGE